MNNALTALLILGVSAAVQAQSSSSGAALAPGAASSKISLTRTMKVERISATEYFVECTAIWGNVNPQAHYSVTLAAFATDMSLGYPAPTYGDVDPLQRKLTLTDPTAGSLRLELTPNGTLIAQRTYTHSSATLNSYTTHQRYCEGNAFNYTDALPMPRYFVRDTELVN